MVREDMLPFSKDSSHIININTKLMYYQTKFRYEAKDYRDKVRKKTASLLVLAETFGDAEEATFQYCEDALLFNPEITSVLRSPIREAANPYEWDEGIPSWIVTLEDTFVTEEGKEKKLKYPVLFWSVDMPNANDKLVKDYCLGIDPSGNQMKVVGVKKSDIIKEL